MQILTTKQLHSAINSFSGKAAALQETMQQVLVSVAYQAANGRIEHANALIKAIPYGVRVELVRAWLLAHLPIKVNERKDERAETPFVLKQWKNPHGVGNEANKAFALSLADKLWHVKPAPKAKAKAATAEAANGGSESGQVQSAEAAAEEASGKASDITKLVSSLLATKAKLEKMGVHGELVTALDSINAAMDALTKYERFKHGAAETVAKQGTPAVPTVTPARKVAKATKAPAKQTEVQTEAAELAKAA